MPHPGPVLITPPFLPERGGWSGGDCSNRPYYQSGRPHPPPPPVTCRSVGVFCGSFFLCVCTCVRVSEKFKQWVRGGSPFRIHWAVSVGSVCVNGCRPYSTNRTPPLLQPLSSLPRHTDVTQISTFLLEHNIIYHRVPTQISLSIFFVFLRLGIECILKLHVFSGTDI